MNETPKKTKYGVYLTPETMEINDRVEIKL